MDKGHLQAVLARINAAPEGADVPLSVEDVGLLHAFVTVRQRSGEISPRERALIDRINELLTLWHPPSESGDDAQRRHQLMLRKAIDKAQQNNWSSLQPDEWELLRSTHHVLGNVQDPNKANARLHLLLTDLFKQHDAYTARHAANNDDPDARSTAAAFGERCAALIASPLPKSPPDATVLQAASFFQRVTPAAVGFVGGCAVSLVVRTFEVSGHTRIEGDIPSDVLLRVKDGSLTVDGFVAGHLVVDGDIIIRGNVQGGWVIATRGSVLLDRALLGSRLIAEGGAVWCTSVEAAACVFGWRGVAIKEAVLSSFLGGGGVWCGEKIAGSTVEACGPVVTPTIEGANLGPTVICLEREIASEVYGRHMTEDVRAMRRAISQHERTIQRGARLMRYVRMLSQNCYRTAIFYLVGGVRVASVAPEYQELQGLALHLEELLNSAESVTQFYDPIFTGGETRSEEDIEFFTAETIKSLEYIVSTVNGAGQDIETRFHSVILNHVQSFTRSLRFLQRNLETPKGASYYRDAFQRNIRDWRDQYAKTRQKIEALVATFEVHPDLLERVQTERDSLDKLLTEVMHQASTGDSAEEAMRAHSPLIRVLLSVVERNRKSIQHVYDEVEHARKEMMRLREKLAEETAVLFADTTPGAIYVEAESIESGTVITTVPELRQGVDGTMRDVIVLQQPVQSRTQFVLENNVLRRAESRLEPTRA